MKGHKKDQEHQSVTITPDSEFLLQFFEYQHLPKDLQLVSMPFWNLAHNIVDTLPRNPERTMALRYLLSAKDSAVRAKLAR